MAPPFESGNTMYCIKINNQTVWTNPLYPGIQCSVFSVSINENASSEKIISVYPNPVSDFLSVDVNSNTEKALTLVLYNLLGVEQKQFSFSKSTQLIVNDVATGIYIYKIMEGDKMIGVGKIVKE